MSELSLSSFQQELAKREESGDYVVDALADRDSKSEGDEGIEFDGYALRDCIYEKWGESFDVDFQRVDSYGFRSVYLVSYYGCRWLHIDYQLTLINVSLSITYYQNLRHAILLQNILPFRLGGKRFRHQTEFDYLCHLQAVVSFI